MFSYECKLTYCEGTSDKVYFIRMTSNELGFYNVTCEYGRRGGTLKTVVKSYNVDHLNAASEYNKVRNAKIAKGYTEEYNKRLDATKPVEVRVMEEVVEETVDKAVFTCSDGDRQKALERLRAASA